MALKKLPYSTLKTLLGQEFSCDEEVETKLLINKLKHVKQRGWLTRVELIEICYWKSARAIRHIESNHFNTIKRITSKAFSTRDEREKIELLITLKGVSIPMASAILTLTNPRKYGVIDIRVWEVLYALAEVETNRKGTNFNVNEWMTCLSILRHYAQELKTHARHIERTIFNVHEKYQKGVLYKKTWK